MKKFLHIITLSIFFSTCQNGIDDIEHLSSYVENNEARMELLRNWDIYFEPERNFWSCKHWYDQDSLLSFLLIYVDGDNNVYRYNFGNCLEEDSMIVLENAVYNTCTLYAIKCINQYDAIGTHEVFSDTFYFDYCIILQKDKYKYQMNHAKGNDSIDNHLYGSWYIRNLIDDKRGL